MLLPEQAATLRDRLDDVAALAARTNKATVLVVQQFPVVEDSGVSFPPVRESIANLMAFVELGTASDLEAVLDMVQRLERGISEKAVVVCGAGPLVDALSLTLPHIGASVIVPDAGRSPIDATIVLGASQKRRSIDAELIDRMPDRTAVYDLGIGNLTLEAAERARAREFALYRLDNRAGISSAIVRLLETDNMISTLMGRVRLRNIDVVAGGLLAPAGAVIVDDIRRPTMIFGVADGAGRFKREPLDPDDHDRVQ